MPERSPEDTAASRQPAASALAEGLYDRLITQGLDEQLVSISFEYLTTPVEDADLPDALAAHLAEVLRERLRRQRLSREAQVELVNSVIDELNMSDERLAGSRRLVALRAPEVAGQERRYPAAPQTPLGQPALLINTRGEPSLGNEIRGELASADRVDLLCAFIKWYGLRTMEAELSALGRRGVPLRVITTTYMGATDRRAVDRLVNDFGAQVRISYEIERTRLHAKAWLFARNSTYHTAYVGSSNLSRAALLDGVEWNVRLTQAATPALINKFGATFDTYWNDPGFEPYDPARDAERLDKALAEAGGGLRDRVTLTLSGLEVRPYPHQQQVLESLSAEREIHDRHRNLVVAATGTGKTVIAALDYKRLCPPTGPRPSLLFIAHRREILEQALRTYREVLADSSFGEVFVGGERPTTWQHVFASVQSMKASTVASFDPSQFEIVVIDEFHHAAAASYRSLMEHFQPRELLALTATPERTDGFDIRSMFGHRTAAEIRLWDALAAELLCPFHYFGIDDGTDLEAITWVRGRYDVAGLEALYTGNDARARLVLAQLRDKVTDLSQMRALGFCVGVDHAEYMARVFREAGIPCVALSGSTPAAERARTQRDLAERRINAIFTADLFNEGVDIPDVDTVLFLRPTESSTIFLQQLGRGLRRTRDKAVLTVLDFVGNQRAEFRYEARFTAMTGIPRGRLAEHAEKRFPHLPTGCQIILDRQSEKRLLQTLKQQTRSMWASVVAQLREMCEVDFATFLDATGIPADQVLKGDKSWARARIEAGLLDARIMDSTAALLRRNVAFAHVDDPDRAAAYLSLLTEPGVRYDALDPVRRHYARMLLFSAWPHLTAADCADALDVLHADPVACEEFAQVIRWAIGRAAHLSRPLRGELALNPLRSHARYSREELCAALDRDAPGTMREGVFHSSSHNADALWVTLHKSESEFGPTTMYEDYAISPTLFHWQSQSTTSLASPTGQRYVNQREDRIHILLFSRSTKRSAFGSGEPYLLLGQAHHVSHRGEKPITIEWQLDRAMPEDHFLEAGVEAG